MKSIIGAAGTMHDQSWYDGNIHWVAERYSRIKGNRVKGDDTCDQFFREVHLPLMDQYDVFAFTMPRHQRKLEYPKIVSHYDGIWDFYPTRLFDCYYKDNIFYADHHQSHAAYAYLMSGFEESDILALDGGGGLFTGIWCNTHQHLFDLTNFFNLGRTWIAVTSAVGHQMTDGQRFWQDSETGKVMGLAGYGQVNFGLYALLETILEDGSSHFNLPKHEHMIIKYAEENNVSAVDIAATMQRLNDNEVGNLVRNRKSSDNICLSGGVAYNGYMNEMLTKIYDNVYVPPAVGDEGQSLGIYTMADYVVNNNVHIPNVYSGQVWDIEESTFEGMDKCSKY